MRGRQQAFARRGPPLALQLCGSRPTALGGSYSDELHCGDANVSADTSALLGVIGNAGGGMLYAASSASSFYTRAIADRSIVASSCAWSFGTRAIAAAPAGERRRGAWRGAVAVAWAWSSRTARGALVSTQKSKKVL